jgi:hypothetical protein
MEQVRGYNTSVTLDLVVEDQPCGYGRFILATPGAPPTLLLGSCDGHGGAL